MKHETAIAIHPAVTGPGPEQLEPCPETHQITEPEASSNVFRVRPLWQTLPMDLLVISALMALCWLIPAVMASALH
ncbi:MAG: hypothetical protein R3348_02920 [Xanthomonadales bacterium]|nr:hypothetical protein [Xanthomonadales bacterium]